MKRQIISIAKYTFLEAIKNHLFILVLIGILFISGIGVFVGELSVTETREMQSALAGFMMRLSAVFVIGLFVITTMIREFNDKTVDMIISLDLPRHVYFIGKLAGFLGLVIIVSLLASIPLLLYSGVAQVVFWTISLVCELFIVITLCLLCLFTFGNITIAFTAAAAFYLLARCISTIQLISHSPILETGNYSQILMQHAIDFISFLLPHLDQFTRSEWLVYESANINVLSYVVVQTIIYVILLSSAALFDLYRKNF